MKSIRHLAWTIDGVRDPSDCTAFGINRLELPGSGRTIDKLEPLFESLAPSSTWSGAWLYVGDGTLDDGVDDPAIFTQPLDGLDIVEATERSP